MNGNTTRDIQTILRARVVSPGGARHGLVIGVENYRDCRLNLRCARADAQAVYDLMVDLDCGMFPRENVQLLLDAEATRSNVWRAFSTLRRSAGRDDTVWIFFAGHAASEGTGTYWVLHDSDVDDLYGTGLSNDEITRVLEDIRAHRLIVFLDCCHAAATAIQKHPTRAVIGVDEVLSRFGGEGRVKILSSKSAEKSVELSEVGHGAFTYFLDRGLRGEADRDGDGVVTADELWDFLRHQVSDASQRVGNRQTPVLLGQLTHDLALTLNPLAHRRKAEIAAAIEERIGLGGDRFSTDEAAFLLEILRRGPKNDAEQVIAAELESLPTGSARIATLRVLIAAALRHAPPGLGSNEPQDQVCGLAEQLVTQGRLEEAMELLQQIPPERRQVKTRALLDKVQDLRTKRLQAETRCRAHLETAQRNLGQLADQERFEEALTELNRFESAATEYESERVRDEALAWLGGLRQRLRAALTNRQEQDRRLVEQAGQLLVTGDLDAVTRLLEGHPGVARDARLRLLLDEAKERRQRLEAEERSCRERLVSARDRVGFLNLQGDFAEVLDELTEFQREAARFSNDIVRSEALGWIELASREACAALNAQREQAESLYQEALRLLDDGKTEDLVRLLDSQPAASRDARLKRLLDDARDRMAKVEAIRRDVWNAVKRQDYEDLLPRLAELERVTPLTDREKQLFAQLRNWQSLEVELRAAMLRYRGQTVLDFQAQDVNLARLKQRCERFLEVERLWETVRQSDDDGANLRNLERIILLDPNHEEAQRRIKPVYGRCGWNVARFDGHAHPVVSVTFSADGRKLMSRDAGGAMKIWSLDTKTDVTPVRRKRFEGRQMCVSPYGDYSLSGFGAKTITVWDARTGEEIGWLEGHEAPVHSLAFSPDGKLAMSASEDNTIRIWALEKCQEVGCFADKSFAPLMSAFSCNGDHVVAGSPGRIRVWRIEPPRLVFRFDYGGDAMHAFFLSPDVRHMCWLDPRGQLALVDIENEPRVRYLGKGERTFCFSSDGEFLATGNYDNLVALWSTGNCQRLKEFHGHRYSINCVALSPDNTRIASASDDETVRLWDVQREQEIRLFAGHQTSLWKKLSSKCGDVTSVAFSPDGRYVASGSRDRSVQVWYAGL